jgi:hypothetical protein
MGAGDLSRRVGLVGWRREKERWGKAEEEREGVRERELEDLGGRHQ